MLEVLATEKILVDAISLLDPSMLQMEYDPNVTCITCKVACKSKLHLDILFTLYFNLQAFICPCRSKVVSHKSILN